MLYASKLIGLKIVVSPERLGRDKNNQPTKVPGKYVKFVNGRFRTEDAECVKAIEAHQKRFPSDIVFIDDEEKKTVSVEGSGPEGKEITSSAMPVCRYLPRRIAPRSCPRRPSRLALRRQLRLPPA